MHQQISGTTIHLVKKIPPKVPVVSRWILGLKKSHSYAIARAMLNTSINLQCLRMKKGCSQTYAWPQQKDWILAHATDCLYLAEADNMAVVIEGIKLSMGTEAPSVKLANMKRKNRELPDVAAPKGILEERVEDHLK
jgi:hypothetical protein